MMFKRGLLITFSLLFILSIFSIYIIAFSSNNSNLTLQTNPNTIYDTPTISTVELEAQKLNIAYNDFTSTKYYIHFKYPEIMGETIVQSTDENETVTFSNSSIQFTYPKWAEDWSTKEGVPNCSLYSSTLEGMQNIPLNICVFKNLTQNNSSRASVIFNTSENSIGIVQTGTFESEQEFHQEFENLSLIVEDLFFDFGILSENRCEFNKSNIISIIDLFEKSQQLKDPTTALSLFTQPITADDTLLYKEMLGNSSNAPTLYNSLELNIILNSYKVSDEIQNINANTCLIKAIETRNISNGSTSAKIGENVNLEFEFLLTQDDETWKIDTYNSTDKSIKQSKYGGFYFKNL